MLNTKEKTTLNILNPYFLKLGCKEVTIEYDAFANELVYRSDQFYCNNKLFSAPIEIEPIIVSIIKNLDEYYSEEGDEYYQFNITIFPNDKEIEIKADYTIVVDTDNPEEIDYFSEDDPELKDIFNELSKQNSDILTVEVDAGGDSGWIETNQYDINGKLIKIPSELEDFCFKKLQQFPGWEINEGSSIKFEFYPNYEYVKLNFAYRSTSTETDLLLREKF